jgi:uncharacterized protein (DUF2249 family)
MTTSAAATVIDVRTLDPRERHPRIFGALDALSASGTLDLVVDHEPMPLKRHLEVARPGQFDWAWLERGPEIWRVQLKRAGSAHGAGSCCGHCGGGA